MNDELLEKMKAIIRWFENSEEVKSPNQLMDEDFLYAKIIMAMAKEQIPNENTDYSIS